MKMKLPPNVVFHHDLRLMVWRPRGILDEKEVRRIVGFLEKEEDRAEKPFNRFTDNSKFGRGERSTHNGALDKAEVQVYHASREGPPR